MFNYNPALHDVTVETWILSISVHINLYARRYDSIREIPLIVAALFACNCMLLELLKFIESLINCIMYSASAYSSLKGLRMLDPPLGPPLTLAHFFSACV